MGQSEDWRQPTQCPNEGSHTGVVPEQSALVVHACMHFFWSHTKPASHWELTRHRTQLPALRSQAGIAALQSEFLVQSAHRPVTSLQSGLLAQSFFVTHCTHAPRLGSQCVAVPFVQSPSTLQGNTQVWSPGEQTWFFAQSAVEPHCAQLPRTQTDLARSVH